MKFQNYRRLVGLLKKKCPPAFPISVRRIKMKKQDGFCFKNKGQFHIRICRDLNEKIAIEVLLHEWAHARAWNHIHDVIDHDEFEKVVHDAAWGVAYAEVYRIFEQSLSELN